MTQAFGVSGREDEISALLKAEATPFVDSFLEAGLYSVIGFKKGSLPNAKKIMISAHKDEIGFCVVAITGKGLIKVRPVGGIPVALTYGNRVRFENGIIGVVGCDCNIDDVKGDITKLYIDIGAKDKEDAQKFLSVGDFACYHAEYTELQNGRVSAKALDDRIGCYIMMECMKKYPHPAHDVYYVFSSQEEVGLRGAKTSAQAILPDEGIAVDISGSFDTPDTGDKGNVVLGGGAAIKVMDNAVICDRFMVDKMKKIAEEKGIKAQLDVLAGGGTDAGAINQTGSGIRSGGISIPTRFGRGPISMVEMADVQACIDLLGEYLAAE